MAGYEVLFGIRYRIQTPCRRPRRSRAPARRGHIPIHVHAHTMTRLLREQALQRSEYSKNIGDVSIRFAFANFERCTSDSTYRAAVLLEGGHHESAFRLAESETGQKKCLRWP